MIVPSFVPVYLKTIGPFSLKVISIDFLRLGDGVWFRYLSAIVRYRLIRALTLF